MLEATFELTDPCHLVYSAYNVPCLVFIPPHNLALLFGFLAVSAVMFGTLIARDTLSSRPSKEKYQGRVLGKTRPSYLQKLSCSHQSILIAIYLFTSRHIS